MAAITPDEARAYLHRWKLVGEMTVAEIRTTPMETKIRQLAALMAARNLFPPDPDRDRQIQEVRERWALLRKALSG